MYSASCSSERSRRILLAKDSSREGFFHLEFTSFGTILNIRLIKNVEHQNSIFERQEYQVGTAGARFRNKGPLRAASSRELLVGEDMPRHLREFWMSARTTFPVDRMPKVSYSGKPLWIAKGQQDEICSLPEIRSFRLRVHGKVRMRLSQRDLVA